LNQIGGLKTENTKNRHSSKGGSRKRIYKKRGWGEKARIGRGRHAENGNAKPSGTQKRRG